MGNLKLSIITVSYNAGGTIAACIQSVIAQVYPNVEYIVIDGESVDGTQNVIERYKTHIDYFVSETDKGIYDAINKGIAVATGDIIGVLHADDFFADTNVLSQVANAFNNNNIEILYGDLDFINPNGKIARKWRSGTYSAGMFNRGWMPPHPTFYCKKELFEKFGNYSLEFGTAADYELMLRFIHFNKIHAFYLESVLIKMKTGGVSNQSYKNRLKAMFFDLKAMHKNGIYFPLMTLLFKPLRKLKQFF